MKNLSSLFIVLFVVGNSLAISAQEITVDFTDNYKKRHAIHDYTHELTDTDTIPDFALKKTPIKITGTVFMSDRITPAKDVILYIEQPDDNGNFEVKKHLNKRYVTHRGWIKTNEQGQYTFYTFVPGAYRFSRALKAIDLAIMAPNQEQYSVSKFIFEDDPRLTKSCRKRMAKHGIDRILSLVKEEEMLVARKDIVLNSPRIEWAQQ